MNEWRQEQARQQQLRQQQQQQQERARQEQLRQQQQQQQDRARQEQLQRQQEQARKLQQQQQQQQHQREQVQQQQRQQQQQRDQAKQRPPGGQDQAAREKPHAPSNAVSGASPPVAKKTPPQPAERGQTATQKRTPAPSDRTGAKEAGAGNPGKNGLEKPAAAPGNVPSERQVQRPAEPRKHDGAGAAQGSAPPRAAPRKITVDAATTVTTRGNASMTINRARPDGSRLVLHERVVAGDRHEVVGYVEKVDRAQGIRSVTYTDGKQVVVTKNYVKYSAPREVTVTRYSSGLRDAWLPNGRPVFREEIVTRRFDDGRSARVIQRTVFTTIVAGTAVALAAPVVHVYGIVPFHGVVIYPYYPVFYEPVYYSPFYAALPAPVVVGTACVVCPPPVVAFADPVVSYTDPQDLVADLQIATAMDDGMSDLDPNSLPAPPPDASPPPAPAVADADVSQLQSDAAGLRQEVAEQATSNDQLRDQVAVLQAQPAPPPPKKTVVPVPSEVRDQIRDQVKQDIQLQQQKKPLVLPDVLDAGAPEKYLFQVASPIDATADDAEACALSTGDLLRFDEVPDQDSPSAGMRVVTSKPGSCAAGSVVQISMSDLQEMLNGFRERLEANMQRVHDQVVLR